MPALGLELTVDTRTFSLEQAISELEQRHKGLNMPGLGWFKAENPSYYQAYEKLVEAILPTLSHYSNVELFKTQFKKSIETLINSVSPERFSGYMGFIIDLNKGVLEGDMRENNGSRSHSPLLETLQAMANIIKCRGEEKFREVYSQLREIADKRPNDALQALRGDGSIGNTSDSIYKRIEDISDKHGLNRSCVLENYLGEFLKNNEILLIPSNIIEEPYCISTSSNELTGGMVAEATLALFANAKGDNKILKMVLQIEKDEESALAASEIYKKMPRFFNYPELIGVDGRIIIIAYADGEDASQLLKTDKLNEKGKETLLEKILSAVEEMHLINGRVLQDIQLDNHYIEKDKAEKELTKRLFYAMGLDLKSKEFQKAQQYVDSLGIEDVFYADAAPRHFRVNLNNGMENAEITKLDENMKRAIKGLYGELPYIDYLLTLAESLRNLAEKVMIEKRMQQPSGKGYQEEFDALNIIAGLECLRSGAVLLQKGRVKEHISRLYQSNFYFDRLSENFDGLKKEFKEWYKINIAQLN